MLWWDWTNAQRWGLLALMAALASIPCIAFGWLPYDWETFLGGMSFFVIPQLLIWSLLVGLKTGRIPAQGEPISRTSSPKWFWAIIAMNSGILLFYLYFLSEVSLDMFVNGI